MASASIPLSNMRDGYTIVTQVIPLSTALNTAEQHPSSSSNPLRRFLKGEPKALGTVQIMSGLFILLSEMLAGMWIQRFPHTIFVFYGLTFFGSIIHIIAGSLTVSASNKLHPCKVKAVLTFNILSAIVAVISIIIISIHMLYWGFSAIILIFSLLQFAVSVSISAFACKATCSNESSLNAITVVPNPESYLPVDTSFSAPLTQLGFGATCAVGMSSTPAESPPAYCEAKSEFNN